MPDSRGNSINVSACVLDILEERLKGVQNTTAQPQGKI